MHDHVTVCFAGTVVPTTSAAELGQNQRVILPARTKLCM